MKYVYLVYSINGIEGDTLIGVFANRVHAERAVTLAEMCGINDRYVETHAVVENYTGAEDQDVQDELATSSTRCAGYDEVNDHFILEDL